MCVNLANKGKVTILISQHLMLHLPNHSNSCILMFGGHPHIYQSMEIVNSFFLLMIAQNLYGFIFSLTNHKSIIHLCNFKKWLRLNSIATLSLYNLTGEVNITMFHNSCKNMALITAFHAHIPRNKMVSLSTIIVLLLRKVLPSYPNHLFLSLSGNMFLKPNLPP